MRLYQEKYLKSINAYIRILKREIFLFQRLVVLEELLNIQGKMSIFKIQTLFG